MFMKINFTIDKSFFFFQVEKTIKDSTKLLGNSKLKNNEEKLKEQFKR